MEPSMSVADFLINTLIALLGGVLIGLERERAQLSGSTVDKRSSIPGMRSFGLLSVYGAITSYVGSSLASGISGGPALVPMALAALLVIVVVHSYARMVKQRVLGVTTYIVMLIAYFVGFLAGLGLRIESASLSVLVTLVLALKDPAERLAAAIRYNELLAMLEVAAVALILGPVIRAYSLESGLSIVYKVYIFFTIVLLVSFASYAAARLWGEKGILYAAALGSLVNSEATISGITGVVGELQDEESRTRTLRTTVPVILAVLQARAALLAVAALYIFTGQVPSEALATALALVLLGTLITMMSTRGMESRYLGPLEIQSPLSWTMAARSALAYTILTILFTITPLKGVTGSIAVLALSAIGGLVNATATILSLATTFETIGHCTALVAIYLAITTASLNKVLYADTTRLSKKEYLIVVRWSIFMSTAPLLMSVLVYATC